MQKAFRRSLFLTLFALALAAAGQASAADGYFLIGYGARQKALGGAGVADSSDAMALSVNPAGIVGLEREMQFGMTAILPERGYTTQGVPVVVAPGDVRSGRGLFGVPNSAYVQPIDGDSAWGYASYANGGLNTAYSFNNFRPPVTAFGGKVIVSPSFGGPLGGGFAGLDLQQAFMSVTYARRFGSLSFGVAPTIAAQRINIQGLKILSPYSSDMSSFSDNGYDWSFGGGLRGGLQWAATDRLRFALAASTPMFMSAFDKYAGVLADSGRFNIPANIQAGVAYDVLPNLTLMADWKHVFYSSVRALGNSSFPIWPHSLGASDGPGFDWRDTDSIAAGAEWRASTCLTLRGGYHYGTTAPRAQAATLNIFAPALNKHHIAGGFNYQVTKNTSIDFAAVYAFRNSITGFENVPFVATTFSPVFPVNALPRYNTNATVTAWAQGLEFTLGLTYKFDPGTTNWLPAHL